MIIHVMSHTGFSTDFANTMTDNNFHFLFYGSNLQLIKNELVGTQSYTIYEGIKDLHQTKSLLYQAEKIILHSLFLPFEIMMLFRNKNFCIKTTPIFWGGDLYETLESYQKKSLNLNGLKVSLRESSRKKLFKFAKQVGCIIPEDYEFFKKSYNSNAAYKPVIYSMQYFNEQFIQQIENLRSTKKKSKEIYQVMVGNSSNRVLQHEEVYQVLTKYNNVEVCSPLSYGDLIYQKEVINKGKLLLENRFIALVEFMKPDDYLRKFSEFDAIIINTKRQMALGNIYMAILLGITIILPRESQNSKFLKTIGVQIADYENLKNFSEFKEFLINANIDYKENIKIVSLLLNKDTFFNYWKDLLE